MGMGRSRPVLLEHRGEGAPAPPDKYVPLSELHVEARVGFASKITRRDAAEGPGVHGRALFRVPVVVGISRSNDVELGQQCLPGGGVELRLECLSQSAECPAIVL